MKLLLALISIACCRAQTYDLIISGGRIVDGSGNAWFYGDIAVKGDRIARITPPGLLKNAITKQRLDAKGMVVAPGFIDIQSHSRYTFLQGDGRVISKVTQGITTEIMGEGSTNAPANGNTMKLNDAKAGVDAFPGPRGFDQWLRAMERLPSAVIAEFRRLDLFTSRRSNQPGLAEIAAAVVGSG